MKTECFVGAMAGKIDQTDWARLHAMTDEEAEANALADPDSPPFSAEQMPPPEECPASRSSAAR